jgi:predicted permease
MPSGFTFVEQPADVFVSLQLGRSIADTGMNTRVIARLRAGTTIARAQTNIDAIFEALRQQGLAQSGQRGVQLESYQKWIVGDFRTSVLMLFGAVSLLLLIACANVASLLMARASSREREISIRLAIGSGPWNLLQQFLAESMLIAFTGSLVGLLASSWTLKGLISLIPWNIPLTTNVGLDYRVLVFTLLITVGTSVVFGFTSYWQASRLDLNTSLKESNASGWRHIAQNRARNLLVIGEIAVSVMLLIGAGLLIESLYRLHQQRLGFSPDHVFTMTTPFGPTAKLNASEIWDFEQNVLRRIQATPGIASAAVVSDLPLTGPDNLPTQHEGNPEHSIGGMEYRAISSRYFKTMQISVIEGRAFRDSDTVSSAPVAIVSASVARAWWKGKSPIGDRIVVGEYKGHRFPDVLEQPRQVVGVVADVKNLAIDEALPTTVYVPASQLSRASNSTAWVVRAKGNFAAGAVLRRAINATKPNQRVLDFQSMPDIVAHSFARPNFDASLMSTFAALALALTSVGIYGLLSFQVARRTREIGIRMALGAKRASVLLMIVKQGASLAAFGLALGVIGAVVLVRFVSSLLVGVRTGNLLVYALVSLLLFVVALFASFVPARRASRVDPLIALRYE